MICSLPFRFLFIFWPFLSHQPIPFPTNLQWLSFSGERQPGAILRIGASATGVLANTAAAIAVRALLVAGVAIASTHRNGSQAKQSQAQAHEAQLQAERVGGSVNVASNPNAQKKLDEQKSSAESQK